MDLKLILRASIALTLLGMVYMFSMGFKWGEEYVADFLPAELVKSYLDQYSKVRGHIS